MLVRPVVLALALVAALFEFHSPFWLDLHHRLYAESGRVHIEHKMPPEAQKRWQAAVAGYRELYPERSLKTLFENDAAQATRRALDGDELSQVDPKLRGILQTVAAVYREHIWPSDQKADARFIEALQPLLARHGATVAKNMAAALVGGLPPEGTVHADVTAFAGPVGAYTTLRPVLIAISSTEERIQGQAALEVLFHEAGHALIFPVHRELRAALEEAGKTGHEDLWHALLFFTAGEVVKRQLGPGYVPYAKAQHLWERANWSSYLRLFEKHWLPVIDGKAKPSEGVKALVAAL